ncbi:hypothetical protein MtrunA17_Chr8g0376871 [Medicago truncatula]|uniref:Uncharacterized protein n=1 Tax=Medicago truncatula TaxID=3880 RepID=A0A396GMT5_MEDTR|nr:hypothetical protein MtrunA17_Chr8g0376871 [Medicago truncatula]
MRCKIRKGAKRWGAKSLKKKKEEMQNRTIDLAFLFLLQFFYSI